MEDRILLLEETLALLLLKMGGHRDKVGGNIDNMISENLIALCTNINQAKAAQLY